MIDRITFDIGASIVGAAALIIALLAYRRTSSPPNVKLFPDNRQIIPVELLPDSRRKIIRFFVSVVLANLGATTSAILDIYPRITYPNLRLDIGDEQNNNSYWYVLLHEPAKSPMKAEVLEGHTTLPINIEIRFYFDTEEDITRTLGTDRLVELTLDYTWSTHKKEEHLVRESKPFRFKLASYR